MSEDPRATRILDYWLTEVGPDGWYVVDPACDLAIRERFFTDWENAVSGQLRPWLRSARESLAFLILLDQFTRNLFRGQARAFSADPTALRAAVTAVGNGYDQFTSYPAKQFFYLPFMHSERLSDQERCVRLFLLSGQDCSGDNLSHAVQHREVIRRFGRFPSRNAPLGRRDSDAERAYRASGGYMS